MRGRASNIRSRQAMIPASSSPLPIDRQTSKRLQKPGRHVVRREGHCLPVQIGVRNGAALNATPRLGGLHMRSWKCAIVVGSMFVNLSALEAAENQTWNIKADYIEACSR